MVDTVVTLISVTGNCLYVTTYNENNTHVTIHIEGGENLTLSNDEAIWLADELVIRATINKKELADTKDPTEDPTQAKNQKEKKGE